MGDALIVGRGGSSSGGSSGKTLVTKIIQATQSWKVPKAKDQKFYIRVFGGGGGGGFVINSSFNDGGGGGGGGMMNNTELTLEAGTSIPITIGIGGIAGNERSVTTSYGTKYSNGGNGGTTSFGTYLAANGGGGGAGVTGNGGNGGSGGGAGVEGQGGNGYQFGGGGAKKGGGFGGYWGGAGGGSTRSVSDMDNRILGGVIVEGGTPKVDSSGNIQLSGYGGNGNNNGINTISNDQVPNGSDSQFGFDINLQGAGESGVMNNGSRVVYSSYLAGGGFGGNGGKYVAGGGGGYGADGGAGGNSMDTSNSYYMNTCGGGGGGYGGNGGDAYQIYRNQMSAKREYSRYGGGGGGYGPSGTGGSQYTGYPDGGIAAGGAGGGQNMNNSGNPDTITPAGRGGNGICIIQYYA